MSVEQSLPLDRFHHRVRRIPAARHPGTFAPDEVASIGGAIARWAETHGSSPALIGCRGPAVTFAQLSSLIAAFAHQLARAGIEREDRIGLIVPAGVPSGQLIVALACNACLVPINPQLTPAEVCEVIRVSELKAVVIPRWLNTPARAAVLQQPVTLLEAAMAPDGGIGLELVTACAPAPVLLRPVRGGDVALLLRSSGTTGAPKLIPVTHGNLVVMAGKMSSDRWFGMSSQDRAACTGPLYYAAGLKTTLFVPLMLGASVAFPPDGRATHLAEWMDVLKPTYLSTSPASLNGIVARLRTSKRRLNRQSLRFVMCGSAYLPEDVRLATQELLEVPVVEYYGLSEAGVMAANPVSGKVKPGTVGLPAPGELKVVDGRKEPVAPGAIGHIIVSGPSVMPGYVMTERSQPNEMKDGWLTTGDLGRIDADGYLTLVGRVKEVINRGGEKVFPYEVEKAILEHPAVLEAAAFGVPHPRLGENVAAAAVLKPGSTVSPRELKEFLVGRLATFKLPRHVSVVPSLPRGNTGKVIRRALTEAYIAAPRPEVVQPECLMELEILDVWARLLGTDDIGVDEDFFERGGDSLLATEMLVEVERLVGKPYPLSELSTFTIRHIAQVLRSALPPRRELMTQIRSGTRMPLFLCHGDYLTRGIYAHQLAALLSPDQPVYLLHSYADGSLGSTIEEVARSYAREVRRVAPDGPIVVGGYCNGGLAAWHLAHVLEQQGVQVAELLLLETISLNARAELRMLARLCALSRCVLPRRAADFLQQWAMRSMWIWRRRLAHFICSAARRKILAALRWEPPPELRSDTVGGGQVLLGMMSRYVPPRIGTGVTCFIAEDGRHFDTDPRPWRPLVSRLAAVMVPGTHTSTVVSERRSLARAFQEAIERAQARSS